MKRTVPAISIDAVQRDEAFRPVSSDDEQLRLRELESIERLCWMDIDLNSACSRDPVIAGRHNGDRLVPENILRHSDRCDIGWAINHCSLRSQSNENTLWPEFGRN